MNNMLLKRYKIYEYIRDNENITEEMSNTKKIIINLEKEEEETIIFCNRKIIEERKEIEEAKTGNHFHTNVTKREILVNEISQYIYWLTLIWVSKKLSYEESKIENKLIEILKQINVKDIGEKKQITIEEIIEHDLDDMKTKEYLREVVK